ncbi:MAG: hypothetical protein IKJ89_00375 [Kiritimatiellae bacterium]|nr:hypothetical protein [Kiritimatiellia bacterium]
MNAQDMIEAARLVRVRELQTALTKAAAENLRLKTENEMLFAHFDLAILAANDLAALPPDGRLVIVDGWNMILGANKVAKDRAELIAQAKAHVAEHPSDFVWIVLDGPRASSSVDGRVRVSYTGGVGAHRADKFICDFLKMARFRGDIRRVEVRTDDKDFKKEVKRIFAS